MISSKEQEFCTGKITAHHKFMIMVVVKLEWADKIMCVQFSDIVQ